MDRCRCCEDWWDLDEVDVDGVNSGFWNFFGIFPQKCVIWWGWIPNQTNCNRSRGWEFIPLAAFWIFLGIFTYQEFFNGEIEAVHSFPPTGFWDFPGIFPQKCVIWWGWISNQTNCNQSRRGWIHFHGRFLEKNWKFFRSSVFLTGWIPKLNHILEFFGVFLGGSRWFGSVVVIGDWGLGGVPFLCHFNVKIGLDLWLSGMQLAVIAWTFVDFETGRRWMVFWRTSRVNGNDGVD